MNVPTSDSTASVPHMGHDHFGRNSFLEIPGFDQDAVKMALEIEIRRVLNFRSFCRESEVLLKGPTELRLDMLFSVLFAGDYKSLPKVLIPVELKSHPDSNISSQLSNHIIRLKVNFPECMILPLIFYNGKQREWSLDIVHSQALFEIPKELREIFRGWDTTTPCLVLNFRSEEVQRLAKKSKFEAVYIIFDRIWTLNKKDLKDIFVAALKLNDKTRTKLYGLMIQYITDRTDFTRDDLVRIEASCIEPERRLMMEAMSTEQLIMEKGVQKGVQKGIQGVAESMIRDGVEDAIIVKHTKLPADEVSNLRTKLNGAGS